MSLKVLLLFVLLPKLLDSVPQLPPPQTAQLLGPPVHFSSVLHRETYPVQRRVRRNRVDRVERDLERAEPVRVERHAVSGRVVLF